MNINVIFAVLVLKGIITQAEADELVSYVNDKPQSTVLRDAIAGVAEVIGKPVNPTVMPQIGPVGPAQFAEEMAARTNPVAPEVVVVVPEPDLALHEAKLDSEQTESNETVKTTPVKKTIEKPHKK